jgi:hypothetical protein
VEQLQDLLHVHDVLELLRLLELALLWEEL